MEPIQQRLETEMEDHSTRRDVVLFYRLRDRFHGSHETIESREPDHFQR